MCLCLFVVDAGEPGCLNTQHVAAVGEKRGGIWRGYRDSLMDSPNVKESIGTGTVHSVQKRQNLPTRAQSSTSIVEYGFGR